MVNEKKEGGELKGKIGLEIHCYLTTKEKLFCDCIASREKGLKANTLICPICTGQPGAKPMLPNKVAVEKGVQIGLMLGCKINKKLVWQRKHYDWPDMPKGYQNTISGKYAIPVGTEGKFNGIGIWEMHLEEDPASWDPETGEIDYNRSGLPLVEIVTAPDFSTAEEVMEWLKKLIHNLEYLKAVDSNAGIKVDTNVSLQPSAGSRSPATGTERCEIKNISSIEDVGRAINYEIERQSKEGNPKKETRRFDSNKGKTEVMRSKESGEDYRFISDPDLLDIVIDDKFVNSLKDRMPENPEKKLEKLIKKYKIDKKNAEVLAKNIDIAEFYEKVAEKVEAGYALPWVTINLFRLLNDNNSKLDKCDIKVEHFVSLLGMIKSGKITELQGKDILKKFYPKSFDPSQQKMEGKITDKKELEKVAEKVLKANEKAVNDYKRGDKNALNFLLGAIMKETQKRADFKIAREVLEGMMK
jgi:aspartyl-tRNA(Asn)/glutamyl-tRNA(Gln) amidotransferase subunit B